MCNAPGKENALPTSPCTAINSLWQLAASLCALVPTTPVKNGTIYREGISRFYLNTKGRFNEDGEQIDYIGCDSLQAHITKLYKDAG
jgi:hypothetical protein